MRNNNPLNIRIGNVWLGEDPDPTDKTFEQFVSLKYGLRAAFVLLRRYIRHYGLNTISDIIRRWAPASENNTDRYISFVANKSAIAPDEPIRYEEADKVIAVVQAMAMFESAADISNDTIREAYNMA